MLNDFLHVLVGAGLVTIGIFAAALADRIRGLRVSSRADVQVSRRTAPAAAEARIVTPVEIVHEAPAAAKRASKSMPGADDVISALVAAGYKKSVAERAAWDCSMVERATVESWMRSALVRCAKGAVS